MPSWSMHRDLVGHRFLWATKIATHSRFLCNTYIRTFTFDIAGKKHTTATATPQTQVDGSSMQEQQAHAHTRDDTRQQPLPLRSGTLDRLLEICRWYTPRRRHEMKGVAPPQRGFSDSLLPSLSSSSSVTRNVNRSRRFLQNRVRSAQGFVLRTSLFCVLSYTSFVSNVHLLEGTCLWKLTYKIHRESPWVRWLGDATHPLCALRKPICYTHRVMLLTFFLKSPLFIGVLSVKSDGPNVSQEELKREGRRREPAKCNNQQRHRRG